MIERENTRRELNGLLRDRVASEIRRKTRFNTYVIFAVVSKLNVSRVQIIWSTGCKGLRDVIIEIIEILRAKLQHSDQYYPIIHKSILSKESRAYR